MKNQVLYNKPLNGQLHWGFRRFKQPEHYESEPNFNDQSAPYSLEQYELAAKMSEAQFFEYVQSALQTISETPNETISRNLKDLCDQAHDRIEIVDAGIKAALALGGNCMNDVDYDIYSTPSRDGHIIKIFDELSRNVTKFKSKGLFDAGVSTSNREYSEAILAGASIDQLLHQKVYDFCPITIAPGLASIPDAISSELALQGLQRQDMLSISLNELRLKIMSKKVSFHPNDNLYRRWGFSVGKKTTCNEYYGYAEEVSRYFR